MRRARWLLGVALPVVVVASALTAAGAPAFRYRLSAGPCLKEMIYDQTGHIDYAAVGGSRLAVAFHPTEFQAAYHERFGEDVVAHSFGRSWYGADYSYAVVRDLLERRPVGHLLVMAELQREEVYNPEWFAVARNRDLVRHFLARPHALVEHYGHIVRTLLGRVRDVLVSWATPHSRSRPRSRPRSWVRSASGALNTCYEVDYAIRPRLVADAQAELASTGFSERRFDFGGPGQAYQRYFYREIVALAQAHGTRVTFIHMARLSEPHWEERSRQRFEAEVGARLLHMPVTLRQQLSRDGYRDTSHLHVVGRARFLPWLVSALHGVTGSS